MDAEGARKHVLAIELDQDELACRLLEAITVSKRPIGKSATAALNEVEAATDLRRAALAAMRYFEECVNAGSSTH